MSDDTEVTITGIDLDFMDLLAFFLKAGLALIPAVVMLAILIGALLAIFPDQAIETLF